MIFETNIRVRFRDTDMYGHVNNSSFATYMEEARIQFMEEQFGDFSLPLILASASYQFVRQTKFPEHRDLTARMWFTRLGNSSADIQTELVSSEGTVLCTSATTVVHFDYESQRATPIPDDVRAVLVRYYHEAS